MNSIYYIIHMSRELRDVIKNYITSLRPFGGKNLPSADFAFTSLDMNELCTITLFYYG